MIGFAFLRIADVHARLHSFRDAYGLYAESLRVHASEGFKTAFSAALGLELNFHSSHDLPQCQLPPPLARIAYAFGRDNHPATMAPLELLNHCWSILGLASAPPVWVVLSPRSPLRRLS
jgi:hypothetical protein